MKKYSKTFLLENISILVDKNFKKYKENNLNKYLIIDFDETNIYLISIYGLFVKYKNYKDIEWIPDNLKIGKQFQKIEYIFYNDNYTQLMYAYEEINLDLNNYLNPMKKYILSTSDRRTIDICSILISDGDISHLSDIKNLYDNRDSLTRFLSEH